MKKLNNIFKMISQMEKNANEVNLAKHEVELSLTADAEKSFARLKKAYSELEKDSAQYVKLKKEQEDYLKVVKSKFYEVKGYSQEGKQIEEKLMTAFRELGLPIEDFWPAWRDSLKFRLDVANDLSDRERSYLWKNK